jgi:hypothetical protein
VPDEAFDWDYITKCTGRVKYDFVPSLWNGKSENFFPETLLMLPANRRPVRIASGRYTWNIESKFLYVPNPGTDGSPKGHNWFLNPWGFYQRIQRKSQERVQ